MTDFTAMTRYDVARAAIAEARRVDEVLQIRSQAERMRFLGRQARDRSMIADAMEIQLRAERRLGQMLAETKRLGLLSVGGRPPREAVAETGADAEPVSGDQQAAPFTLAEAGIDKKLSASAQRTAESSDDDFEAGITRARDKILSGGAALVNPHKDISAAAKKDKRAQREATLGARQRALPDKRYGVILADPEWTFEVYSEGGMDRSAGNHYPTSSLEAIKARPVESIAADDCVLYLWVTVPHLDQGLEVLKAWGFTYKSNHNWEKDKAGTGYWSRNNHEHLLIGTRGSPPAPAAGTQDVSSMLHAVREHSRKPEYYYELIERYFPNLPKIELNARQAREGWDAWGNEAPENASANADDEASVTEGAPPAPSTNVESVSRLAAGRTADAGEAGTGDAASPALSIADRDAVIREVYGRDGLPDFAEIEQRTGLDKVRSRKRAYQLGLSSRERQRAAASAYTTGQHRRGVFSQVEGK